LNIVKAIDEYYKDRETAYMFLSDHGFGVGRGHDVDVGSATTKTPLWLWGKGFNVTSTGTGSGEQTKTRHKDLSLLISLLVGNPLPTDSTGTPPLHLLPSASDYFKATALILACQSSLVRMKTIYDELVERGDRLLQWSSARHSMDSMTRTFEQLQLIVETKPEELSGQVIGMAQAAHLDILKKSDGLVWRNAWIAIGMTVVTLLMSAVSLWGVGFGGVKGSGETGAFSVVALLVASVVSLLMVLRGVDLAYHVWCWAAALVFAMNGAVMSLGSGGVKKESVIVALTTTLLTVGGIRYESVALIGSVLMGLFNVSKMVGVARN
jgi:hypothetical protein